MRGGLPEPRPGTMGKYLAGRCHLCRSRPLHHSGFGGAWRSLPQEAQTARSCYGLCVARLTEELKFLLIQQELCVATPVRKAGAVRSPIVLQGSKKHQG